jgi:hypothetical protein
MKQIWESQIQIRIYIGFYGCCRSGSGSRRAKMTTKIIMEFKNFIFEVLDVLF